LENKGILHYSTLSERSVPFINNWSVRFEGSKGKRKNGQMKLFCSRFNFIMDTQYALREKESAKADNPFDCVKVVPELANNKQMHLLDIGGGGEGIRSTSNNMALCQALQYRGIGGTILSLDPLHSVTSHKINDVFIVCLPFKVEAVYEIDRVRSLFDYKDATGSVKIGAYRFNLSGKGKLVIVGKMDGGEKILTYKYTHVYNDAFTKGSTQWHDLQQQLVGTTIQPMSLKIPKDKTTGEIPIYGRGTLVSQAFARTEQRLIIGEYEKKRNYLYLLVYRIVVDVLIALN